MNDMIKLENLTTECILLNFIEPVFFVKKSNIGERYITLLYDDEKGEYLLAKTNNIKLLGMLNKKITMRELFENAINDERFVAKYDYDKEEYVMERIEKNELSDNMLPKRNAYFELENEVIADYIEKLKSETLKDFLSINCKQIIYPQRTQKIQMGLYAAKEDIEYNKNIDYLQFVSENNHVYYNCSDNYQNLYEYA